jgi:hypothetical protein
VSAFPEDQEKLDLVRKAVNKSKGIQKEIAMFSLAILLVIIIVLPMNELQRMLAHGAALPEVLHSIAQSCNVNVDKFSSNMKKVYN